MKTIYKKIFFLLAISSCSAERTVETEITDAEFVVEEATIVNDRERLYSEYFEEVRYIPLETTKESVITEIASVMLLKNAFLIIDVHNGSILEFDSNGTFIRKFGVAGSGPGEYGYVSKICWDEREEKIYALDIVLRKIIVFDVNGNLDHEVKLNFEGRIGDSFALFENGFLFPIWAASGSRDVAYIQVDRKGQVTNRYLDKKSIAYNYTKEEGSWEINDFGFGITLVPRYSNKIYRYKEGTIRTLIEIKPTSGYDEKGIEQFYLQRSGYAHNPTDNFVRRSSQYQGMHDLGEYLETGKFFFFTYVYSSQQRRIGIYIDKETGSMSTGYWNDDLTKDYVNQQFSSMQLPYLLKWAPVQIRYNTEHAQLIEEFKRHVMESPGYDSYEPRIQLRMDQLSVNSNPVLILYKLKEEYL